MGGWVLPSVDKVGVTIRTDLPATDVHNNRSCVGSRDDDDLCVDDETPPPARLSPGMTVMEGTAPQARVVKDRWVSSPSHLSRVDTVAS